jgi:hypothetical protein
MSSPFTKDYTHDAMHLLVKKIRGFQADGRQWLAAAYTEGFDRCLEQDDGETVAIGMNYIHGFERYCVDYLGMDISQFESKADRASKGA